MQGRRVAAVVHWNLDALPGWNDNPDDVKREIERLLEHYNATVTIVEG